MPRNVYSEIFLHIVWHTKDGAPMVRDGFRDQLYEHIVDRCRRTDGVRCYGIGGTPNHLHLAVSVPPTLAIAEWIGKLKGASSHYVNRDLRHDKALQWQTGYGVVSFGRKRLPYVVDYVKGQEEHHAAGTVHHRLERIDADMPNGSSQDGEAR
jgi:putative transposase